ncbi:MAG: hypothetical protein R3D57_01200 [Hyphomicrobiaceae bacterium]
MAGVLLDSGQLVLESAVARSGGGLARSSLHAISLLLIGVSTPLVSIFATSPSMLADVHVVALASMIVVFVVAGGIYVHSVLSPGQVICATFDHDGRTVTLVRDGRFAVSHHELHFSEIADVGMMLQSESDGRLGAVAELRLKNGRTFPLPDGMEEGQMLSVREILGLA